MPNLLAFDESLPKRRDAKNHLLIALARHGLGEPEQRRTYLDKTLTFTNNDQHAVDLSAALNKQTVYFENP